MSRADGSRRAPADYARAIEAAASVVIARFAIRFLPFRHLTRVLTRPLPRSPLTGSARTRAVADVRWAVTATAARLPGRTPCFARAVAAQAMLRRRGVSATLFYGATTAVDRRLRAHVWLRAGDEGVVGHEAAQDYVVIAAYAGAGLWIASSGGA